MVGSDKIARSIKRMIQGSINVGKRLPMKAPKIKSVPMRKTR